MLRDRFKEQALISMEPAIKKLADRCLQIIKGRVPHDTRTLMEEGLQVVHYIENEQWVIKLFISNALLSYPGGQSINARELAMKLELGVGRNGNPLLRTQLGLAGKNLMRTPTADWWKQAEGDIREMLTSNS